MAAAGGRPRLTVRLTLPPFASSVPAAGFCLITRPFFTFFEYARLTLPVVQWAAAIARFAAPSGFLTTFGTTHGSAAMVGGDGGGGGGGGGPGGGGGGGGGVAVVVAVQVSGPLSQVYGGRAMIRNVPDALCGAPNVPATDTPTLLLLKE